MEDSSGIGVSWKSSWDLYKSTSVIARTQIIMKLDRIIFEYVLCDLILYLLQLLCFIPFFAWSVKVSKGYFPPHERQINWNVQVHSQLRDFQINYINFSGLIELIRFRLQMQIERRNIHDKRIATKFE